MKLGSAGVQLNDHEATTHTFTTAIDTGALVICTVKYSQYTGSQGMKSKRKLTYEGHECEEEDQSWCLLKKGFEALEVHNRSGNYGC